MKARVIATGEIVNVIRYRAFDKDVFYDSNGQNYNREELSFDVKEKSFPKDDPDYWTRLEHTYAGMAMQGILSNPAFPEHSQDGYYKKNVVNNAYEYAHALVEKMKEERE